MTLVRKHREKIVNGETYFVEQYADKPHFVWFWRCGWVEKEGLAHITKDGLWTRPNLKRIFNL